MLKSAKLCLDIKTSGFMAYAPEVLENDFTPSTDDHKARAQELGKFTKRLNRVLTPLFNVIWEKQFEMYAEINDILFLGSHVINARSMEVFTYRLARLDIFCSELKKLIEKYSKQAVEVKEYYEQFSHIYEMNGFETFLHDLDSLYDSANEESKRLAEFSSNNKLPIYEDILPTYKNLLKKAKSDIAEERKKRQKAA